MNASGEPRTDTIGAAEPLTSECEHRSIQTFYSDPYTGGDGTVLGMWACDECRVRFYPACRICVDVGHRDQHATPDPAAVQADRLALRAALEDWIDWGVALSKTVGEQFNEETHRRFRMSIEASRLLLAGTPDGEEPTHE